MSLDGDSAEGTPLISAPSVGYVRVAGVEDNDSMARMAQPGGVHSTANNFVAGASVEANDTMARWVHKLPRVPFDGKPENWRGYSMKLRSRLRSVGLAQVLQLQAHPTLDQISFPEFRSKTSWFGTSSRKTWNTRCFASWPTVKVMACQHIAGWKPSSRIEQQELRIIC